METLLTFFLFVDMVVDVSTSRLTTWLATSSCCIRLALLLPLLLLLLLLLPVYHLCLPLFVQVTPIDLSYYGTYRCLAMNVHGKDEHAINLREARPPGPLLQVKFETITGM